MNWFWQTMDVLVALLPGGLFTAWCLWAVNWRRTWPVLAAGGWLPLLFVVIMAAYGWAMIYPRTITLLGMTIPNYTWQLGAATILTGVGLFAGWLQGQYGWEPETVSLDPPEDHGDHGDHGHHGHH